MAFSSIISISSGNTASLRPPVQVRLSTFIWMLSCIMSSNTPLTRTPNTPIYGFLSFSDSVNDLMKRSLSNCCPEYASYASFKRRTAPENLTFSHSLSSCGRSSMYKNLHLPVLATISYTLRMESQQLTSTNWSAFPSNTACITDLPNPHRFACAIWSDISKFSGISSRTAHSSPNPLKSSIGVYLQT